MNWIDIYHIMVVMRVGAEVKHALLDAGIESSHSYERTHIDSVEQTDKMVDVYLRSELI